MVGNVHYCALHLGGKKKIYTIQKNNYFDRRDEGKKYEKNAKNAEWI